jgi:hypothetical protein
VEADDESNSLE